MIRKRTTFSIGKFFKYTEAQIQMQSNTSLNLCTLPLELIENNVYQKCLLPKEIFKASGFHPGDWVKCTVAKRSTHGFSICQVYPRDIEAKCCYMDNIVGTFVSVEIEDRLINIISIKTYCIEHVEISLELTANFFNSRLRKSLPNILSITAKQILASLYLSVGCAVRTADAARLGISAIYIDSCSNADENAIFQLDSNTKVHIRDFHIGTKPNVYGPPPFFKHGYELAWNELEDLVAASKLGNNQKNTNGIKPQLNVLLCGPPGCGKTSLVNAFLVKYNFNCFHIGTDLQQYAGETEASLRKMFDNALHLQSNLKPKDPTVIIIENLELLCPAPNNRTTTADAANSNRICAQLLKLLDDLHNTRAGIFCIATTSDPCAINGSARRPGRFQHEITIDWPNEQARRRLFEAMFENSQKIMFFNHAKIDAELLDLVAKRTQGFVSGDLALLVRNIEQKQLRKNNCQQLGKARL
ncbi:spermatogenesis-associated protein 5-like protein 1 [Rhagoletis pomonella]|uniref:spermatogenesis-associated protein 5-like protein 1 n=1 Tax=Rhagoletis pomonella TaxID=28610 RepID=UPI00177B5EEB|nr:spermatogenesis-associated protein 5-like protein 1 [Rhagoletis pomonella]